MPEKQKNKKHKKVRKTTKGLLEVIGESIISEIIMNLLLFIPRMIGKLLKVILSS